MPAIFSKNCILMGELDLYCLVCSAHLPGEEDALAHIQDSNHKANLTPTYYEKFKDDFIKKVKSVYFCEVCNKMFATAVKVGIHVTGETHIKERRRHLTRVGSSIVFQKNTLIEESAWNGIVEDDCVLCNIEFDDKSIHISENSHVLNVIRSTVTIDSDDNIYRKVDGGYHCLTCNKIVSDNCITEHLKSTEHTEAVVKDALWQITDSKEINEEEYVAKKMKGESSGDLEKEDPETSTLTSKKSSTDGKPSSSGPLLVKDKGKPSSSKSITKEMETFANQHGLFVNKFNYTVYCTVCFVQIPPTMTCMIEHVSGKKHKDKHSFKGQRNKKTLLNAKDFITKVERVNNLQGTFIIINDKFYLSGGDFFGFSIFNAKLVCQFCDIDVNPENYAAHVKSRLHRNLMDNSFVVTSLENEFVREVKSDLYHCGFCGIVESDFDEMIDHLTTPQHKTRWTESEMMLQRLEREQLTSFGSVWAFLANF